MYRKSGDSWLKHLDFIVLDLVALQLAYISSYALRMGAGNLYKNSLYLNIGIIIALTDICTAFFTEPYRGIMRRGYFVEFKNVLKHVFFDGGQFVQIGKATRKIMVPFLYIAMKSLYWSKGKMLKRIMWCDDGKIKLQMHLLSEN